MNKLLLIIVYCFINGLITWTSILATNFFIDVNRNHASSSYPGDLTTTQEWLYLLISTFVLYCVQFIGITLFKSQFEEKQDYRILYFFFILSIIVFFLTTYFYLF